LPPLDHACHTSVNPIHQFLLCTWAFTLQRRMFSFISMNWRGRPLTSYRTIVELIGATTTTKGLRIKAERDTEWYPVGVKISDAEIAGLPLTRHDWHGDWNYTLHSVAQSTSW